MLALCRCLLLWAAGAALHGRDRAQKHMASQANRKQGGMCTAHLCGPLLQVDRNLLQHRIPVALPCLYGGVQLTQAGGHLAGQSNKAAATHRSEQSTPGSQQITTRPAWQRNPEQVLAHTDAARRQASHSSA